MNKKLKINKKHFVFISFLIIVVLGFNLIFSVLILKNHSIQFYLVLKVFKPKRNIQVLVKNPFSEEFEVKKLIALPKDTVLIINGIAYVNNMIEADTDKLNFVYFAKDGYLTIDKTDALGQKLILPKGWNNPKIFPFSYLYRWNEYQFGKIIIPFKGKKIKQSSEKIYKFLAQRYEQKPYLMFEQDYVFVLDNNRFFSKDSRVWGPIPKKYVVGKIFKIFEL